MIMYVKAPMDRMKELILQEHPNYYLLSEEGKTSVILEFIKECDAIQMYEFMRDTQNEQYQE